jgi:HEAT repeat protein
MNKIILKPTAKAFASVLGLGFLLFAAFFYISKKTSQSADSTSAGTNLNTAAALLWHFNQPTELKYAFSYSSTGSAQIGDSVSPNSQISVTAAGELSFLLNTSAETTQGRFKFTPATSSIQITPSADAQSAVQTLEGSITLSPKGAIVNLTLDNNAHAVSANVLRSVLAVWNIPLPTEPSQPWFFNATTPFGETAFSTIISEQLASSGSGLQKLATLPVEPNRIIHADAAGFLLETLVTQQSSSLPSPTQSSLKGLVRRIILLTNPVPIALTSVIEKSDNMPQQFVAESKTEIGMALIAMSQTPKDSPLTDNIPAAGPTENPLAPTQSSSTESEISYLRNLLGNSTSEELISAVQELEGMPKNTDFKKRETDLYLKLKALVLFKPDEIPALIEAIQDAKPNSLVLQLMGGALMAAGTPAAQNALVDLMKERIHDSDFVESIVPAIALTHPATTATREFLTDLSTQNENQTLRSMAILALGNAARNTAKHDAQAAIEFEKRALAALQTAQNPDDTIRWLAALGNAGMNSSLAAFENAAQSSSPRIRAQAAYSLRFLTHPKALSTQNTLLNDPLESVRNRSVDAVIDGKQLATVPLLEQRLAKESAEGVRLRILQALWPWRNQYDRVLPAFQKASQADSSEKVRAYAKEMLTNSK